MTDLTTGVEEGVVIDLMIDHTVQEVMIEEGEEDMLREVTEEATIEEEVDMTEDTLEVMTEEEEVDMIEEVIEDIQEGILAEVMVTREDTTVDIVEADTNQEGVAIEEEEDMKVAQEITLLQEGEVTIGQENTQVLEAIQVTALDTKIEDLHLAAILDQAIQEEVAIDLERMIAEDILRGEIILPQIVTKVGVHHLLLHLILLPVDIAVDHQLKDLIDMARVVSTEVNTEAVAEVEITAQLTLLVIEKIVAMIQGAMILVHEGIRLQEKTIMLVVAAQPEAVLRQQPILDMQVKNVKRKQVIQLKGIKFIDNSKYKI